MSATSALTATDRCDRCGARAYVRVLLPKNGELLFCAHHGRAHQDALREKAVEIQDESHALDGAVPAPLASAAPELPRRPVPAPPPPPTQPRRDS